VDVGSNVMKVFCYMEPNLVKVCEKSPWFSFTVFVGSILVTLIFWSILPSQFAVNESTDYVTFYEPVARNILDGHGFIIGEDLAIRYPPGYPLILAGIFGLAKQLHISEGTLLSAFILLSMGLSSVFVFCLARTVWGSLPALVSSFVWMTFPFALWLTKQPNSEMVFMSLLFGGFYIFWNALVHKNRAWPIYFFSGLLIGFAMLVRPIAIGVGIMMGVILWVVGSHMTVRLRLFLISMVLIGNFVAIFPWEVWVHSKTGRVVLLSGIGQNSLARGLTFHSFPDSFRQVVPHDISLRLQDIEARADEMESFGSILFVWADEFKDHPLSMAKLFALKAARSWYGTDSGRHEKLVKLIQIPYMILFLFGSFSAWKQGGIARHLTFSIWLIVFYSWGMATLGVAMVRYMVPPMGLLMAVIPAIRLPFRT